MWVLSIFLARIHVPAGVRSQARYRSPGAKSWSVRRYSAWPGKNRTASAATSFQTIWRAFSVLHSMAWRAGSMK